MGKTMSKYDESKNGRFQKVKITLVQKALFPRTKSGEKGEQ